MKPAVVILGLAFMLTPQKCFEQSNKGNDPAWERFAEAKGTAAETKPEQCIGDANSWHNDSSDQIEKLPTVDLLGRKYEMDACYILVSKLNAVKEKNPLLLTKIASVAYNYTYELFIRAKNVLADHALLNEFLEKGS